MMVLYDPRGYMQFPPKPWTRTPFVGCYGDRQDAGLSNWVVPGTWPDWML